MAIGTGKKVPSAAANGKNGHSLISDEKFRQLYELALRLHSIAKRASGKGSQWLRGHEALLAGVAADLRADDLVVAEYAGSMEEILRGAVAVRTDRRDFEERVIEALSVALSDRMRKTRRVSVIFSEGTQSEKALIEARVIAGAARLPVLFVGERRDEKTRRQEPAGNRKRLPALTAYPTIPVDMRDVIAMYRVAHESIERARDGSGPTHIVAVRRDAEAGKRRNGMDAVEHLEEWLMARGLPAQEWRKEIESVA
jgi:pyruvate dehydrogenase E1 component alpha subunit